LGNDIRDGIYPPLAVARVIWTEPARRVQEGIRVYIGQFNPLAAQRLPTRRPKAPDPSSDKPAQGRSIPDGRRYLFIIRPYRIRYRVARTQALTVN
jgi:toxin ParE1/3/4